MEVGCIMWVGLVFRLLEGSTVPSAFVCPTQEVSPVTLVIYSQPSTGQCSYCAAWRNLYALEKNRTKTYSAIWSLLCFDPSWTRPFFPIFYSLHLGVKGNQALVGGSRGLGTRLIPGLSKLSSLCIRR